MSVDFEPVRLTTRRRRTDPVVIGVVAVVIALAAAVLKPWESGSVSGRPDASASAPLAAALDAVHVSPGVSAGPAETGRSSAGPVGAGQSRPTWAEVAPFVTARDAWGVDAILFDRTGPAGGPGGDTYLESWSGLTRTAASTYSADIPREDRAVVALGVTFPFDEMPRDARIWRVHTGDQLEWIDARPVDGGMAAGSLVFERPGVGGAAYAAWPAGEYRIDVLIDDFMGRIDLRVPAPLGTVPAPDAWPASGADLVAANTVDPSVRGQGPFAVVDGKSVGLVARLGPRLDEPTEWRESVAPDPGEVGAVAVADLPRATGLGVMFTEHAVVGSVTIRRLAPDDRIDAAPAFGGVSSLHGRTPFVVFVPPGGGAWSPGVYAIAADWTDPAGAHSGTWHVELRPGPLVPHTTTGG